MASLADFYPLILPECMGAPLPAVDSAIVRAAIRFCEQSLVWDVELDPIRPGSGVADYDLDLPRDSALVNLTEVKLDGTPLRPIASLASYASSGDGSAPIGYMQPTMTEIRLVPTPPAGYGDHRLTVRAALKPDRNPNSIDDSLFNEWADGIAAGARSTLKRQPGKAWTDLQGATIDASEFATEVLQARSRALHGHVRGSLSIRPVTLGGRPR